MFGRAGRNGCPARGHLLKKKKKSSRSKIQDKTLSNFVNDKICRRKTLLSGMGEEYNEFIPPLRCCDVCTPSAISSNDRLNVLELGKQTRRPKRSAIRKVNEQLLKTLKERLYAERKAYIDENPCLSMLGVDFVCPDSTIDELCLQAEYLETASDISLYGIRTDIKDRFFNVISDVLYQYVPCKRRRCA